MELTATAQRHASKIQWISTGVIVAALFVAAHALPLEAGIAALRNWIQGLGAWGPVAFAVIYVVATLLFVPGSALTLVVGAMFGLWGGTVIVSLASTTSAAFAFLIARHLAREAIARRARRFPRFDAIDRAIAEGGVRIVALLRLSPAVPFSLGNYLFGLTGIRWLPYVVTSWVFMLPGTFLYVYLGYAGARGLAVASGGDVERTSTLEGIALGVGLVATLLVTVYVTRLARRKIAEQTEIQQAASPTELPQAMPSAATPGWPWRALLVAAIAIAAAVAALWTRANAETLAGLFGPP